MHSHVLHCVCVCSVSMFLCEMTDIVKDGWLGRLMNLNVSLHSRGAMQFGSSHGMGCVCAPIPEASPTQPRLRLSDPSVWPLLGPPLGPTSPGSAGIFARLPRQDSFRSGL